MSTLSGAPCSLTGVGARLGEEEGGLLRGLRLFAVDVIVRAGLSLLTHPGLTLALRRGLTSPRGWGSPHLLARVLVHIHGSR